MNHMILKFLNELTFKIIWLSIFMSAGSLFAQTTETKLSNAYQDLILSTIRPEAEINLAIENHLIEINEIINSTNTPGYDKGLYKAYSLLVKEIRDLATSEGLNVINASLDKVVNQISTNSEYKEVKIDDLRTLSFGLIEILQVLPQATFPTID
jgi:hypothetical protein